MPKSIRVSGALPSNQRPHQHVPERIQAMQVAALHAVPMATMFTKKKVPMATTYRYSWLMSSQVFTSLKTGHAGAETRKRQEHVPLRATGRSLTLIEQLGQAPVLSASAYTSAVQPRRPCMCLQIQSALPTAGRKEAWPCPFRFAGCTCTPHFLSCPVLSR